METKLSKVCAISVFLAIFERSFRKTVQLTQEVKTDRRNHLVTVTLASTIQTKLEMKRDGVTADTLTVDQPLRKRLKGVVAYASTAELPAQLKSHAIDTDYECNVVYVSESFAIFYTFLYFFSVI